MNRLPIPLWSTNRNQWNNAKADVTEADLVKFSRSNRSEDLAKENSTCHRKNDAVLGVYTDYSAVENAVDVLREAGFRNREKATQRLEEIQLECTEWRDI